MVTTVGRLKKLIKDLRDETPIYPDWAPGCVPSDMDPGVEIHGLKKANDPETGKEYLSVQVNLFYLDEE
jgi:hypothetical protein